MILGTELASAISGIAFTLPSNRTSKARMMSTWPKESQLLYSAEDEFSPREPFCIPRALSMVAMNVVLEIAKLNFVPLTFN